MSAGRLSRRILLPCLFVVLSCGDFDLLHPYDPRPADPSVTWQVHLEGGVRAEARCVQQTTDGGFVLLGTYEAGTEAAKLWLVKVDSTGQKQWARTFAGAGTAVGRSLRPASGGGYLLVGSTRSWSAEDWDVYLVRTDADGNGQWEKSFGGDGDDYGWSMERTSGDGGCVIAGGTASYGAGNTDAYLLKVSSAGEKVWQNAFGGPYFDEGCCVRETSEGFVVAGCTQASFNGDDNAWLIKTDADGNREWDRVFGTIATSIDDIPGCLEQARDVLVTADGYLLAGYRHPGEGDSDAWLINTDAEGNMVWERTFGGGAMDQAEAVVPTADGGYALCGMTRSYGSWNQAWLAKTDADGNEQWTRAFGSTGDEWGFSLQQTADGGYILAGSTTSHGGQQAYLVYHQP